MNGEGLIYPIQERFSKIFKHFRVRKPQQRRTQDNITASLLDPHTTVSDLESHLPPELLYQIFGHFTEGIYHAYNLCHFGYSYPGRRYVRPEPIIPTDYTVSLCNVTRVCKAWRAVGMEVLYAKPYLITAKHIARLGRTLYGHQSYGALVKSLCLLNCFPSTDMTQHKLPKMIITIMQSCPSLQSIVIQNSHTQDWLVLPMSTILVEKSINTRLRHLII